MDTSKLCPVLPRSCLVCGYHIDQRRAENGGYWIQRSGVRVGPCVWNYVSFSSGCVLPLALTYRNTLLVSTNRHSESGTQSQPALDQCLVSLKRKIPKLRSNVIFLRSTGACSGVGHKNE